MNITLLWDNNIMKKKYEATFQIITLILIVFITSKFLHWFILRNFIYPNCSIARPLIPTWWMFFDWRDNRTYLCEWFYFLYEIILKELLLVFWAFIVLLYLSTFIKKSTYKKNFNFLYIIVIIVAFISILLDVI